PRHAPPPPVPIATPAPAPASLAGRIVASDGAALVDARVTVRAGDDAEAVPVDVDADGRFTFSGNAGQTVKLKAQATGYDPASETIKLAGGAPKELTLTMQRRLPSGQIRGLVRSFKGVGLDAEIRIEPSTDPATATLRTQDGRFEVDVAPGTYEVTI